MQDEDPLVAPEPWPWPGEPLTGGGAVFDGAVGVWAVTAGVWVEVAEAEPRALVAMTMTRSVWPTSALASLWLRERARRMLVQCLPDLSHRRHR